MLLSFIRRAFTTLTLLLCLHLSTSTVNGVLTALPNRWVIFSYPRSAWAPLDDFHPSSYVNRHGTRYNDNTDVSWYIEGPDNSKIALQVLILKTEEDYDFLRVYDGDSEIRAYSGNHASGSILMSSGNRMKINFFSDSGNRGEGFVLQYNAEVPCYNEYVEDTGNIRKPLSINTNCETKIKTTENTIIELTLHVQLEQGSVFKVLDGGVNVILYLDSSLHLPSTLLSKYSEVKIQLTGSGTYNGTYISYPRADCNFISTMCQWESVDLLQSWKRSADKQHAYFREIPGYTPRGYQALLQSPRLWSQERNTRCLRLTYHMYGLDVYEMNVYILTYALPNSTNPTGGHRVWKKYGETGGQPTTEVIRYSAEGSYSILIEAIRGYGLNYMYIVDDIKFSSDCGEENLIQTIPCSFNNNLCFWQQSRDDNSNWQFERNADGSDNWHLVSSFGYRSARDGERIAILQSPFLSLSEAADLGFQYWLQGHACLTVQLRRDSTVTVLWSKCGTETAGWIPFTVVVPAVEVNTTKVQLVTNLTTESDIVKLEQVTLEKRMARDFLKWTCDFLESLCGLRQDDNREIYWVINRNSTVQNFRAHYPSFLQFRCGSGLVIPGSWRCNGRKDCPDGGDEVGCGSCPPYLFRCPDDPETCIPRSEICNGLHYSRNDTDQGPHIYCGEESGCLLSTDSDGSYCCQDDKLCIAPDYVWDGKAECRDGSDETGWKESRFCAIKDGDSAVSDSLVLMRNHCPKTELLVDNVCVPYSCLCDKNQEVEEMNNNNFCNRQELGKESTTFLQIKLPIEKSNISHSTSLHTSTTVLQTSEYMCVSFQYLVTALDLTQQFGLRLYQNKASVSTILWGQTGQKSNGWLQAAVLMPYTDLLEFHLRMEATIPGSGYDITIALRNIAIERKTSLSDESPNPCSELLTGPATFKKSLGIWSSQWMEVHSQESEVHYADANNWVLKKSTNHVKETGPVLPPLISTLSSVDAESLLGGATVFAHKSADGYLLCDSTKNGGYSYLWSLPVPSSKGLCIKFLYFMYGHDWSELSIGIPDIESRKFRSVYSISGSHGDAWREAEVNIGPELLPGYSQIILRCNTQSNSTADIAVDNIRLLKGSCGTYNADMTLHDIILGTQSLLLIPQESQ